MAYVVPSWLRPKREPKITFNKLQIENNILKFEIAFLKSENKRIKKKLKKILKML
jgi:hypothetical protein